MFSALFKVCASQLHRKAWTGIYKIHAYKSCQIQKGLEISDVENTKNRDSREAPTAKACKQ